MDRELQARVCRGTLPPPRRAAGPDRVNRDGGAAAVDITTLIVLPVPNYAVRGLHLVLRLVQCA
jgi:hypothetical protein